MTRHTERAKGDTMLEIHEQKALRNRRQVFKDRSAAGKILSDMLAPLYSGIGSSLVVLAIPMGGVPPALKIHERLGGAIDLAIVRKIQIPGNTEAGFGAITHEGDIFMNRDLMAHLRLSIEQVDLQSAKVRKELDERNRRLRESRPFPEVNGKTVILVDDGLASGYTMKASCHWVRKKNAARIVVAVGTAPQRSINELEGAADEIFCPNICDGHQFAVAEAYEQWHDLSEKDVLQMMHSDMAGFPAA
jgi:putative phosphoribosyl transferase